MKFQIDLDYDDFYKRNQDEIPEYFELQEIIDSLNSFCSTYGEDKDEDYIKINHINECIHDFM